jgi:hypothetical protein
MAMPAAPNALPMTAGPAAFPPETAPQPPWPAPGAYGPPPPSEIMEPVESPPDPTPSAPDPMPRVGLGPSFPDVAIPGASGRRTFDPTGELTGPKMLHIPCPEGHVLETPPEMLGEEVICPHCGRQFMLREKDSQEYKRKKKEEAERRDIRAGKRWLTWAVVISAAVLIGLILMIALGHWT